MRKLVLFDVDNTIVRENLTGIICKRLLQWTLLAQACYFLYQGGKVLHESFPLAVEKALIQNDFFALDTAVRKYVEFCYVQLCTLFDQHRISLYDIASEAERMMTKNQSIESICFISALDTIALYACDPMIDILFISGGLHIVLLPFVRALESYLQQKTLLKARLYAYGTRLCPEGSIDVCVGYHKINKLYEHTISQRLENPLVIAAYSDNRYYADLPMLLAAKDRFIVLPADSYSKALPESMMSTFQFLTDWK